MPQPSESCCGHAWFCLCSTHLPQTLPLISPMLGGGRLPSHPPNFPSPHPALCQLPVCPWPTQGQFQSVPSGYRAQRSSLREMGRGFPRTSQWGWSWSFWWPLAGMRPNKDRRGKGWLFSHAHLTSSSITRKKGIAPQPLCISLSCVFCL